MESCGGGEGVRLTWLDCNVADAWLTNGDKAAM